MSPTWSSRRLSSWCCPSPSCRPTGRKGSWGRRPPPPGRRTSSASSSSPSSGRFSAEGASPFPPNNPPPPLPATCRTQHEEAGFSSASACAEFGGILFVHFFFHPPTHSLPTLFHLTFPLTPTLDATARIAQRGWRHRLLDASRERRRGVVPRVQLPARAHGACGIAAGAERIRRSLHGGTTRLWWRRLEHPRMGPTGARGGAARVDTDTICPCKVSSVESSLVSTLELSYSAR